MIEKKMMTDLVHLKMTEGQTERPPQTEINVWKMLLTHLVYVIRCS